MNQLQNLLANFTPRGDQEISDLKIFRDFATDAKNLTRDVLAHFTASAFVINQTHDKVLAIYHNIYQSWGWMGGHADGDADLLNVAKKEVREESGLANLKLLQPAPISLENIPVFSHTHRSRGYVSAHIHLNIAFLFEANESDELRENPAETGGVKWLSLDEFLAKSTENHMKIIYEKIISRIKEEK